MKSAYEQLMESLQLANQGTAQFAAGAKSYAGQQMETGKMMAGQKLR